LFESRDATLTRCRPNGT